MASKFAARSIERIRVQKEALAAFDDQKRKLIVAVENATAALQTAQRELNDETDLLERIQLNQSILHLAIESEIATLHARSVATLPKDILCAIFVEFCLDDGPDGFLDYPYRFKYERASAPFRLASVCQSWRQLALVCPRIWTYAAVPPFGDKTERRQSLHCDRLEIVLRRSSRVPLDVVIPWSNDNVLKYAHKRAMHLLQDHHSRWQRVYHYAPPATAVTSDFFDVYRLPMPILAEIRVEISGLVNTLRWNDDFPDYFPVRDRLRRLDCFVANLFYTPRPGRTNNLSILRLNVCVVPTSVMWAICAESAQSLTELFICCARQAPILDAAPETSLSMPRLRKLALTGSFDPVLRLWSDRLIAPVLDELELIQLDGLTAATFFEHTCTTVTTLTLLSHELAGPDAVTLRSMRRVRKLIVDRCTVHESFFRALMTYYAPPTASWIFPALASVTLKEVEIEPGGSEGLLRLVRARRTAAWESGAMATSTGNVDKELAPVALATVAIDDVTNVARWVQLTILDEIQRCALKGDTPRLHF